MSISSFDKIKELAEGLEGEVCDKVKEFIDEVVAFLEHQVERKNCDRYFKSKVKEGEWVRYLGRNSIRDKDIDRIFLVKGDENGIEYTCKYSTHKQRFYLIDEECLTLQDVGYFKVKE